VFAAVSSGASGSRILTFSSGTVSANVWAHVYVTYDGSTLRTYINGTMDVVTGSGSITVGSGSTDVGIGQSLISGYEGYFNGLIDEARFSSTARSADWIATEYNNQNSPSNFYIVGAAVTAGP
jgi:trimeric autotransporter adhesin